MTNLLVILLKIKIILVPHSFNSLYSVRYSMLRLVLVFYWTFVINIDHHYLTGIFDLM